MPEQRSLTLVGLVLAASVIVLATYASTLGQAMHAWSSDLDYSHGFIVPLVALVYCWQKWPAISAQVFRNQSGGAVALGIGLIVLSAILHGAGMYLRILAVELFSLIVLLAGAVLVWCGVSAFRRLFPAFLFLLFMIPIPGQIIGPLRDRLQQTATSVSVFALQTTGIPAASRGNVILLPDTEVGVAEACSGLRILVSLAALVSAIAMFIDRGPTEKFFLFASIIPIAILINAGRIALVAATAQYQPTWEHGVHDIAGMAMILVAIALIWLLLKFMDALLAPSQPARPSPAARAVL
ncbi:exosortase/archaeosortase family protein [Stieleria sp. TO1_6]|nr:exosortase/archaeosortase family protein [Stieleria tagensis]